MNKMIALLMFLYTALAESPKDILQRAINAQQINNSIQTVEMYHRNGDVETVRGFILKIRKEESTIYSLTQFYYPEEIKGMRFARIDTPSNVDPVMLYIPALDMVRTASMSQVDKPFMGSDFALADFEMNISERDRLDLLRESEQSWTIQCIPYNNTLYRKLVASIDKMSMLPKSIEYHDNAGHLKTLTIDEVSKKGGQYIPMRSTMTNHRTGSATTLIIASIETNVSKQMIPLELFTEDGLKRVK